MRKFSKEFTVYSYSELKTEEAKENAKNTLLDLRNLDSFFYDNIKTFLEGNFPNSKLDVTFSLSSCQGDGLNIYGTVDIKDVFSKLDYTKEIAEKISNYLAISTYTLEFSKNTHYSYSCKFLDKKYIEDDVSEYVDDLVYNQCKNVDYELIKTFFIDILNYFEKLDKQYEKEGYSYFYEMSEEEIIEECEANGYEFFEDGNFFTKVYSED